MFLLHLRVEHKNERILFMRYRIYTDESVEKKDKLVKKFYPKARLNYAETPLTWTCPIANKVIAEGEIGTNCFIFNVKEQDRFKFAEIIRQNYFKIAPRRTFII